ncbi:MAG TPA: DoxX family membrane protein [Candidatus Paceibacterota bacterium]
MTHTNKAIWALRIGVAGEFLGHGVLALQGKADWIGWFAKFGVSDPGTAATLLTLVGIADVLVALIVLFRPIKPIVLWAVFWGFWTALVRPIVGQPIWDFVERFANWGAPLALYFLLKMKEDQRS